MGSGRQSVVVGVLALVAGLAGIGLGMVGRASPVATSLPLATISDQTIEVHVSGWVVSPGVVSVETGAIVARAIDLAGGLKPGANVTAINLAAEVFAGEQVVVPGPQPTDTPTGDGLISLNSATASDLEGLPGVGPVLAGRIVAHRETHGRFESLEDLLEVPGIGEAKLASLREHVRL